MSGKRNYLLPIAGGGGWGWGRGGGARGFSLTIRTNRAYEEAVFEDSPLWYNSAPFGMKFISVPLKGR